MEFKTFVKEVGMSSDGTRILVTPDLRYICFNSDKCSKIAGLDDFLGSFLGNNLRVFTPATVRISEKSVYIRLDLEGVEFVAEKLPIPSWFNPGKDNKILEVSN